MTSPDAPDFPTYHRLFNEVMGAYCGGRNSCHELVLELMAQLLTGPRPLRILDVGCGTGAFAEELYGRFDDCQAVCVDGSAKNLVIAQHTLAGTTAVLKELDVTEPGWAEKLGEEPFDVVFLGWMTHEIAPWKLPLLYGELSKALREGGILFNADFMSGLKESFRDLSGDYARRRVTTAFTEFDRAFSRQIADLVKEEKAPAARTRWNVRHSAATHIRLLTEADFADADEIWRYLGYSMVMAIKADPI